MRKQILNLLCSSTFLAFLTVTSAGVWAAKPEKAPSAQDIVKSSDKVRNPSVPFSLTDKLSEFVDGKLRDEITLKVFAKEDPSTGNYNNLVKYLEPARDAGKAVLLTGTKMWFFDPSSKSMVRISAQQRLLGQAANGDVVTVNLAHDYKAKLIGKESLQDADRKDRKTWHLELKPVKEDAVYSRIETWIEQDTYLPVKSKYFADSGRLLKIAYFRKVEEQMGAQRPTEVIIIDAVDPKMITKMSYSQYKPEDIPDSWFQKDYLPRLKIR